jgi:hypothetical protein
VVVDGVNPDTGKSYSWHGGSLCETSRDKAAARLASAIVMVSWIKRTMASEWGRR